MQLSAKKTIISLLITIGLVFIASGYAYWHIESLKILKFHTNRKNEEARSFQKYLAILNKPQQLLTYDYSYWDEMKDFISSTDSVWAKENLETALETFDVEVIWVLNKEFVTIYSVYSDSLGSISSIELPHEVATSVRYEWFNNFYVNTPAGLMGISTAPIQPSNDITRIATPSGYLITARRWDQNRLANLSELIGSEVTLTQPIPEGQGINSIAEQQSEIKNGLVVFQIEILNSSKTPIANFVVKENTAIYTEFTSSLIRELLLYILFVVTIIVLIFFFTIVLIYNPLSTIISSLKEENPSLVHKLQLQPHEFGTLARLVTQSFDHRDELNREISKQKVVEVALAESENLYRMLVENSFDAICLIHGKKYEYVNPRFCQICGYSSEEILSPDFDHNIFLDDIQREYLESRFRARARGEKMPDEFSLRITNRAGNLVDLEFYTVALGDPYNPKVLAFARDITERRRAEDALKSSETRYKALFETYRDGIYFRTDDGKLIDFNQTMLDIFGYTREEMLKLSVYQLYDVPPDKSIVNEHVQLYGGVKDLELKLRRVDGKVIDCLISSNELMDETGALIGIQGIIRDITARKLLEEQFRQAQKMDSIGRLAGGVAHDFNNMLQAVLGNLELAIRKVEPTSSIFKNLKDAQLAAQRSANLTKQLLAFARKQKISPKALDLNDSVSGMLKMVGRLLGENITLTWTPGVRLWAVKIDPTQIDQILANLCLNASDAIDNFGEVQVETKNIFLDANFCSNHIGAMPGDYVVLSVIDNGSGMTKATMERMFDPFFTTKELGKGTGLGLATVYGIVKQNNGFIDVTSELGTGTKIDIYLPRSEGELAKTEFEFEDPIPRGRGETVLFVEDELEILKVGENMLSWLEYKVLIAATPNDALKLIDSYSEDIHLLVTDVVMPVMNGKEMADQILSLRPNIKCLFISGHTADVIGDNGILEEGTNFLQKPFKLRELALKVKATLAG